MPIEVVYSTTFKRSLKQIAKKYRRVRSDVEPVIEDIEAGNLPGEQISHVGYQVYKARIKNSDSNRGQRGGYRMIYYVVKEQTRMLITLYSKSEQSDISAEDIRRIIEANE
jgi:mRNA-degrading endonuclease RelE of RelBE toxin-antitoxin system